MSTKQLPGRATVEELTLIRDAIMYPYMLEMCDKSLQEVKCSSNLFKRSFEKFIHLIINKISKDLTSLRRELKKHNIKIYNEEMNDGIIYHRFTCRGYEDRFGVTREALRNVMSFRLARYAESIFKPDK